MNSWDSAWKHLMNLPGGTPAWLVASVALLSVFLVVVLPGAGLVSYFERKLGADLQARVGPNRAGPFGVLQPVADFLKLLQKEPSSREQGFSLRNLSFIHTMGLFSTLAVLPLGSTLLMVDTDMSVFLPFWAAVVVALGMLLMGLSSRSVPGWFGGLRVAAQTLTGAFPALITLCCAGLRAGSFRWSRIVEAQGSGPFHWTAFCSPFELLAFIVYLISGLVLLSVPPLDGGHSVSDIHGGVGSLVDGRKLSLFRLGRFYGHFLWSLVGVALFLGGWKLPPALVSTLDEAGALRTLAGVEMLVILGKTFLLMIAISLVSAVTPRLRADQVTDLSWKMLGPLSLLALAGSALWLEVFRTL